ncbi:hypothetical protein DVH24_009285 [Malus domestica]|uniref:TIR domain-containing protein n=1 Tax=Malus domestica TaxID=3750 RepID=A0A498ITE8_MALDO|nr:hypothetical protein DVH24_009285 [Malus domestica]
MEIEGQRIHLQQIKCVCPSVHLSRYCFMFAAPNLQQLSFPMALSTQRASASFLSNESAPRWKYDVFLSFRGVDTRKGFVSHLHHELSKCQGITTFMDDRELEGGTSIHPELRRAIEESHIAIVVLSPNYASSKWCLDELTTILRCMESRNSVLPVFYQTDPSDVGNQRGCFAEAFAKHEQNSSSTEDKEKVVQWKADLKKVSKICGWHSKESKSESEIIQQLVVSVWRKVHATFRLLDSSQKIGTAAIEVISLRLSNVKEVPQWNCEAFSKMDGVRFLEFDNLIFSSGPKSLPCSLRIINWSWYPSNFLPTSFRPHLLAQLKMRNSNLVRVWEGKVTNSDIAACGSDGKARDGWGLRRLFGLEKSRPDPPPCWGLVLSSLNRLCSLTGLDLDNCNLQEGDIPDDIGCLSLLEALRLSRNNFVSLTESIRHLSKLSHLDLEGCKSLKKLPPLPSNRGLRVKLDDCTFLRRFSGAFNLYDTSVSCWNCIALVPDEDLINRILKSVIQGSKIVIPGSEIPKWFNNQSVGYSINVELPLSCTNWLGIAFCIVFQFQNPILNAQLPRWYRLSINCSVELVNPENLGPEKYWNWKIVPLPSLVSENLWLFYIPRPFCLPREDCHQEQFLFEIDFLRNKSWIYPKADLYKVKKCGARLVYEQDLKELNQKLLKRTRETRDEAALSGPGSASFNDTEQIHKRRCNQGRKYR